MKKTVRILQVTAALNEGGVERGTLEMSAYTVSRGVESFVASAGGKLVPELERSGARHVCLPLADRNPLLILWSALKLVQLIRRHDISLVHARSRAPAWAALLACRVLCIPFITTFHGTHKIQNRLKWYYNSVMVRGVRVIAISQFIRRHIMDNYQVVAKRIDLAPRGFDPKIFSPDDLQIEELARLRHSRDIDPDMPVVVLPGRLTRWKGQDVFLQALAEIQDIPWQALVIGGSGRKKAYETELKTRAQDLGIEDRVRFLGSCSDIARYYAIADIVVSASTEPEAFGRVAIEGQAMSKPVIATAHGGSVETVKDGITGWLYPPRDHKELARLLRDAILQPELRERIGAAGRLWVMQNYTLEQMCAAEWAAYVKVLDDVLDNRGE